MVRPRSSGKDLWSGGPHRADCEKTLLLTKGLDGRKRLAAFDESSVALTKPCPNASPLFPESIQWHIRKEARRPLA